MFPIPVHAAQPECVVRTAVQERTAGGPIEIHGRFGVRQQETAMRKLLILMALTAGTSMFAGAAPADAQEYRWCLQGRQTGYPGDCSYRTQAQCVASASGRLADCGINPRAAFAQRRSRY